MKENQQMLTPKDMLAKITTELASFEDINESKYKTGNTVLGEFGNIQSVTDTSELIRAYASVSAREKIYNEAVVEMGLTTSPQFQIGGFTAEDWKADILLRYKLVNSEELRKELLSYKKEFEDLLSKEEKQAILMEKMNSFITTLPSVKALEAGE